jgi:hypothetical protein
MSEESDDEEFWRVKNQRDNELARQRMQKFRSLQEKKCGLCGNTTSLHFHSFSSLNPSAKEELQKVTGEEILNSYKICCSHFEVHSDAKPSAKNPLIVKKSFATLYFTKPSERRNIQKHLDSVPKRTRELSKPQLKAKLEKSSELNNQLQATIDELNAKLNEKDSHINQLQLQLVNQFVPLETFVQLKESFENHLVKYEMESNSSPLSKMLGNPSALEFNDPQYWFGVSDPVPLFNDWKKYIHLSYRSYNSLNELLGINFNRITYESIFNATYYLFVTSLLFY